MPGGCTKQISTENGVVTCDKKAGHTGMHHATHPGGRVPMHDHQKVKDTQELATFQAEPLDIEWPQEGDQSPVTIKRG